MPRNYLKKGKCYTDKNLSVALEEVKDCISQNWPFSERDSSAKNRSLKTWQDVEMKHLKWVGVLGDEKYRWPSKEDIGLVKPVFIFDSLVKIASLNHL